jgi:hypothetical protein
MVSRGNSEQDSCETVQEPAVYEPPAVRDLGFLKDLTLGGSTDVGADAWGAASGGGS